MNCGENVSRWTSGRALTLLRTAAVSGLAASYLARRDARCLLMVGAGGLAPYLIEAHTHVRTIELANAALEKFVR